MKKVNKDYIGVVRNSGGRLQYERIPMLKSVKVRNELVSMAEDEGDCVEDMIAYFREVPVLEQVRLAYLFINWSDILKCLMRKRR